MQNTEKPKGGGGTGNGAPPTKVGNGIGIRQDLRNTRQIGQALHTTHEPDGCRQDNRKVAPGAQQS